MTWKSTTLTTETEGLDSRTELRGKWWVYRAQSKYYFSARLTAEM